MRDEVNVVTGAKGSGKSAMFSLLANNSESLPPGTIVVRAEEPISKDPIFNPLIRGLANNPAPDGFLSLEFQFLWKAYFLFLIAEELRVRGIENDHTRKLRQGLQNLGLPLPESRPNPLVEVLKKVVSVALGGRVDFGSIDAHGRFSAVSVTWEERIKLGEEHKQRRTASLVALSQLFATANAALGSNKAIWLVLDRLDDIFPDPKSAELERAILRALLNVYLDVATYDRIRLKIFLRSDIFRRVLSPVSSVLWGAAAR